MDQQKIDQVLAIVNQGLIGIDDVTYLNTPNPYGCTLRFLTDSEAGVQVVEGLLAQCELQDLFFDTTEDKLNWLLDYFYETNEKVRV
jgi:hypothetical protein